MSTAATGEWSIENLHFAYGPRGAHAPAVDSVSFSLHAGELVAIVGPNGCGKSTLLKLLLGALPPSAGRILLDGKPVREWGRIGMARRAAFVPQMASESGGIAALGGAGFTVQQTVLMARFAAHVQQKGGLAAAMGGLGALAFETPADYQAATQAMWDADVHHLADRDMETLSGGEKQRVAIARAFAQETPAILLDEPTSALDLYHQLELTEHLRIAVAAGRLVVLVTHDLNIARQISTRTILMDQAKVTADGPPEKVLTPPILEPVYQVQVRVGADGMLRFARR